MSLTFGLATTKELYSKLVRDAALLDLEVTSDKLFNFVVTGYSMIDWVQRDPSIPASATTASEVQSLYDDPWLKVCGDLATAVKHFTLTRRVPITASTKAARGFGLGRYGKGDFGVGEESIRIALTDGSSFGCIELAQGVVSSWARFFAKHGM
ncbi:MAG: hypothetical protein M3R04_10545 [bacterium]|nr:hypothetical protein [bacterium]